ncbi:hypothetical protein MMC28_006854 [Mycoblastus sanguinarius]|nr:hypothetical protein [Mycoblastus sanguinarius]
MGLTGTYVTTIILEALLICRPLPYFWDKSIKGTCGNQVITYLTAGIFNLLIDVIIIVLPMPMLWGLQLPRAKKIALTGLFGIGAAICVITILRIKAFHDLYLADLTYSLASGGLWTVLEPTLGIINACLPVIPPVIQRLSNSRAFSWAQRASKSGQTGSGILSTHERGNETSARFKRLDDRSYPLTDTYSHFNESCRTESDTDLGDQYVEHRADIHNPVDPKISIIVQRGWNVRGSV